MQTYIIWFREKDKPDALWADMSFRYRTREQCEALLDHYEEQWHPLYEFEIHRGGICATYPKGMRQACYVGLND